MKPVEVSFLPHGTFIRYITERQASGAALGHLKPPHINPSEKVLSLLGVPRVGVGVDRQQKLNARLLKDNPTDR